MTGHSAVARRDHSVHLPAAGDLVNLYSPFDMPAGPVSIVTSSAD